MSSYSKITKHPITGKWEMAQWLDDYFGKHHYGVRFPSEDKVYNPDEVNLETKQD